MFTSAAQRFRRTEHENLYNMSSLTLDKIFSTDTGSLITTPVYDSWSTSPCCSYAVLSQTNGQHHSRQATRSSCKTPGPVDYNGTTVAAGTITADASLCLSVLQGGLIYEVHCVGLLWLPSIHTRSRAASSPIHLSLNIRAG